MMDNTGAYLTTYRDDYRNPYSRSIIKKPPKPPEWTRNNEDTLYRPDCLDQFNAAFSHPKPIDFECGDEENHIQNNHGLDNQKQDLVIALHESGCPLTNDIIKSLNHSNNSVIHCCKALKSDYCDCGTGNSPGNNERYRDPFSFRLYSVTSAPNYKSPIENVCSGADFYNKKNMLGISEYMDTISKTGRSTMLAVQQFREPVPSSRRRMDGQFIQTC